MRYFESTISEQLSRKLTDFFSKEKISKIAKETGFIKRERIVKGSDFLDVLLFSQFDHSKLSLEEIAESMSDSMQKQISKQAIDKKFKPETVEFFKKLLELAINEINNEGKKIDFLNQFSQVRIKDSTCFQLPKEMAEKYPGSGGNSSDACIRIQFEYDIKTGKILDLSLHPFNSQDISNAMETIENIQYNSLIIRDLGYTSTKVLQGIMNQKAYFISRLIQGVNVYELKDGKYVKLDFVKIYNYMKRYKLPTLMKEVYITEQMLKVNLLIQKMPKELIKDRILKSEKEARKKGRQLTKEYKSRAQLNLFITNLTEKNLTAKQMHYSYMLRWQIELIFKIMKSVCEIHKVKKMKTERFECFLYAKLLWIIINWHIVWQINKLIYNNSGKKKMISFFKCFKSLKNKIQEFRWVIKLGEERLKTFLINLIENSKKHSILEKKRGKISIYDLITTLM